MPDRVAVSIVLCTRNRAAALRDAFAALARIEVPADLPAELLVVDNASSDDAARVIADSRLPAVAVHALREPRPGQACARNTGMAAARGDVILFLDDDVRPPPGWLDAMARPILTGAADAVAGGVRIAPHLERPWMERVHRTWLADTGYIRRGAPQEMVGANMALGRHVLARVPAFDPELGPGALGQGDDSLFSWQLLRAGFRIADALDVAVEHHFDPRRLLRASFHQSAERRGRVLAYQRHHWEHLTFPHERLHGLRAAVSLRVRHVICRRERTRSEGMPAWELFAIERRAFLRQWRIEQRRPRNYERFGLRKRSGGGAHP
jgi:glycosyltransferase involved in cell wall biosynthesis